MLLHFCSYRSTFKIKVRNTLHFWIRYSIFHIKIMRLIVIKNHKLIVIFIVPLSFCQIF